MARGFRSVVAGLLVSALVVALSLPSALSQTLAVGTLSGFESPSALASGSYGYNPPVTALQPWTWTQGYGGVGQSGGPFDPPYPNTPNDSPPSPNQYAFMQTSTGTQLTNMSCTLSGLTAGTAYNLTFWYAARSEGYTGNATQSQLTVVLGTQQLWQSPANIQDSSGWTLASAPFTASTATLLQFNVVASSTNDRSILVDSVLVASIASPLPTAGTVPINTAQAFSFEYPVLTPPTGVSLQSYIYNPQISLSSTAYQPWTFTPSQGGIALTGSPWDPPSPSAPPAGSQYAFLQVSPHSALNDQYSTMTTTVTGLTAGNQYSVSWSSGTRSGYSQTSQLTVSVNGVTLYTSNQNLSDVAGWQYNQSAPFTASGSTCVLQFSVVSLSNSDGAVLIDAVTVGPAFTPTSPYSLTVGTIWGFEGASVGSYAYNPAASVLNPWYWSAGQGGIGTSGSPWDPPYPGTPYDSPPSPNQYAFMQDSGNNTLSNMTAAVTGLLGGLSYTLSFYYAARSEGYTGNTTQSQLTVFFGSQQLWQSPPNIVDPAGWFPVTVQFTPVASSAQLLFAVVAQSANDRSILIDSVLITQTSMPLPTSGSLTQSSLSALSFESPSLLGSSYGPGVSLQNYVYNPQITSSQPWSFSLNQGGIALGGGPWDPLGSNTPPNGLQYAFLQTAPHGAVGDQYCNMSTTVTGLSDGYPYVVSFYWGTRNGYGQNDQLFVTINGQNIYTSTLNLVDSTGWIYAQTSSFTLTVSSAVLSFNVVAQYNNDSALLIDAIQFGISQTALPLTTFAVGTPANFESPVIGSYLYNPSLSVLQPWIFTPGAGGIGYSGGPFDPPYPGTPNNDCPSANQYAFIQTGAVIKTSNMTGGLTGITGGSQYILTFYYAARSEGYTGNGTQSQLTVFFAGQRPQHRHRQRLRHARVQPSAQRRPAVHHCWQHVHHRHQLRVARPQRRCLWRGRVAAELRLQPADHAQPAVGLHSLPGRHRLHRLALGSACPCRAACRQPVRLPADVATQCGQRRHQQHVHNGQRPDRRAVLHYQLLLGHAQRLRHHLHAHRVRQRADRVRQQRQPQRRGRLEERHHAVLQRALQPLQPDVHGRVGHQQRRRHPAGRHQHGQHLHAASHSALQRRRRQWAEQRRHRRHRHRQRGGRLPAVRHPRLLPHERPQQRRQEGGQAALLRPIRRGQRAVHQPGRDGDGH
jgi:hypothetical protein